MKLNRHKPFSSLLSLFQEHDQTKVSVFVWTAILSIGVFLFTPFMTVAQDYNVAVDNAAKSMAFTSLLPGEAQSTVIPPGLKSQCMAGRFLATNDGRRPPDGGSVVWRDLNGSSTTFSQTTFDSIPLPSGFYKFRTNDHDIITMPNGNVVLVWGIHFATTLNPKPAWFDLTFSATFGPGVRRGVMAWRSEDCGQSFKYMGQVDPATTSDGSCALPQYRRDTSKNITSAKPYANGGVDGQLIQLDRATKKIYLMFQCVGQKPDPTKPSFTLTADKLNKTMVLMSPDEGATWNMLGWLNTPAWRYGVVPLPQGALAFGVSNLLSFGKKLPNGSYQFDNLATKTPLEPKGWESFDLNAIRALVYANVYRHTIVTRVPGDTNGVLISYPNALPAEGKSTNGYSLFFFDRSTKQYSGAAPILPLNKSANSFTMHLTAVDLGVGPILLYWYDVNWNTKKATVRGRLVTGRGEYSEDFQIYRTTARRGIPDGLVGVGNNFDLGSSSYWYGDYKTAGGYVRVTQSRGTRGQSVLSVQKQSYNYFPMWVEPDKTIRYIRVTVERGQPQASFERLDIQRILQWRPGPPPVELIQRKFTPAELRTMRDYKEH